MFFWWAPVLFTHKMDFNTVSFKKLLKLCCNKRHPKHEQAWHAFDRRYRKLIFSRISRITFVKDQVEEILQRVMWRLIRHDFAALKAFRGDTEASFAGYLSMICKNTALAYVIGEDKGLKELDPEYRDDNPSIDIEAIHTYLIDVLEMAQKDTQKSEYHKKRDTLMYLLRTLCGFQAKEVAQIPLLNVNPHTVDVIVNRLRENIRDRLDSLGRP